MERTKQMFVHIHIVFTNEVYTLLLELKSSMYIHKSFM